MCAFETELARWGPEGQADRPPASLPEANAYCTALAKSHYENFPVVSWFLPRELHQHFQNVYAYCRWADDLADEIADTDQSMRLLAWWREELYDCYRGVTRHPVFVALAETIETFEIPVQPFADLISAFEQDQSVCEYETRNELLDYCRRSADPVGRIILHLARRVSPETFAYSDRICTGLQLANFWQDVARDFDIGRVYLPRADRQRFGYTDDDLRQRRSNNAFLALIRDEVDWARDCLREGLPLVELLPGRLQVDVDLFARGGLCILDRIAAIDYRVWDVRPVVTKGNVLGLFLGSLLRFGRRSVVRPFAGNR